jgi:SET domain-containing protein
VVHRQVTRDIGEGEELLLNYGRDYWGSAYEAPPAEAPPEDNDPVI